MWWKERNRKRKSSGAEMKITNNKSQITNKLQIPKGNVQNSFVWIIRLLCIVYCLYIGICILVFPVFASTDGQGGQEIAVLKAGVGARALGMGSAFTAISDNSDAPFWNPAGLAKIKNYQISTMQTKLSTDADHYYVSFVMPFLSGGLGISWIQVSAGSITQTSGTTDAYNDVENLGIFNYYSNAYLLAYGQDVAENISVGITAKYLTTDMPGLVSIEGASATGYSVTPGILYRPFNNFSIGFKIDELVNSQKWGTDTEEKAPSKSRLGLAYRMEVMGNKLLMSGDISQINSAGYVPEAGLGAELAVGDMSFRLGATDSVLTAGAGMRADRIGIDYAYVTQANLSKDNVHRISLIGTW